MNAERVEQLLEAKVREVTRSYVYEDVTSDELAMELARIVDIAYQLGHLKGQNKGTAAVVKRLLKAAKAAGK